MGLEHDIRSLPRRLGKDPAEWTREDLVGFCLAYGIRYLNFRYPSLDCKLRELRLPISSPDALRRLLAVGERVDGSSLFPGILGVSESDLYAVPIYRWAFLNPWAEDELDIVCRFVDASGTTDACTPCNVLAAAAESLHERTGLDLHALAELEFYLILDRDEDRFSARAQRNYHQSSPYLHGREIADAILRTVSKVIGCVKYCHSEVGYIDLVESQEPELNGRRVEQHELELDLMPIEDLGCWLTVARWLIREVAARYGASVTFVPKLDQGMAGSGMHLHLALQENGRSVMRDAEGELSEQALRLIGGLAAHAAPLAAFGNTVTSSYLRLVPGQEAPTDITWGRFDRSTLFRVPLDFGAAGLQNHRLNPGDTPLDDAGLTRPTVEYRGPDGSAFQHLLLAAVAICVEEGLSGEESLYLARRLEIAPETGGDAGPFERLPGSAAAAARSLRESRLFFEERGFSAELVDHVIERLEAERDADLSSRLQRLPSAERLAESRRLMHKDLHKH